MKLQIFAAGALGVVACSSSDKTPPIETSMSTETATPSHIGFRPMATLKLGWADGGPTRGVELPIPVKNKTGLCIAALQIAFPVPIRVSKEEADRIQNKVSVPGEIVYVDVVTGEKVDSVGMGSLALATAYFGIPSPPDDVVGHFDDPKWLPPDRLALLRARIFAALDVLLPFFADDNRPWTEAANKAAGEVRDFFPLAAEPGLWPYYKAEGKEFFAWVEAKAPAAKTALPWGEPAK